MKTIKCQHCAVEFAGAQQNDVLLALLPHYQKAHPTVLSTIDEAGKKAWMKDFASAWANAPDQ